MTGNAKVRLGGIGRNVMMLALPVFLTAQAAAVEPPPTRKMSRQIEVMEKIIDQVLLDSPNFLIRGTPVARGAYIPQLGALFTFDASLIGRDWHGDTKKWNFGGFRVEEEDGRKIIVIDDMDLDLEDLADLEELEELEEDEEDEDNLDWRDRHRRRQERVYVRGKTEMVDVLLDYGDTLTTLEDDQWIVIMAYLTDEDFIDRNRMSRLILKAKVSDLRAYGGEDISEKEMVERIVEQEY